MRGVIPVVPTPLSRFKTVDLDSLRRIVSYLISCKVHGLWLLGTGSEDFHISRFERERIVANAVQQAGGNVPVIVGAAFPVLNDTKSFISETQLGAEAFGYTIDGYHVMPYMRRMSDAKLLEYYTIIADFSPKPIWLYFSANWSICPSIEVIKDLSQHPNIVGMKHSTIDPVEMEALGALNRADFTVLFADARYFMDGLLAGGEGIVTSVASAIPQPFINLWNYWKEGDKYSVLGQQLDITRFLEHWPNALKRDNFIKAAEEKSILKARGLCGTGMTQPFREATQEEQTYICNLAREFGYL